MGMVFDIKRYAIHDGPGIRVTVFLKGCPMSCAWCHNPESISADRQQMHTAGRCIGCGECVRVCPVEACAVTSGGWVVDAGTCTLCGACADICPTRAVEIVGEDLSAAEVISEIEKDRTIIDHFGGGVTFSGGEPLMQPEFLIDLLKACGGAHLHRTVDTAGLAPTPTLLEVAGHTDYFLYDLKMTDPQLHRQWTGADNQLILRNLRALAETGADMEIRMPLIDGVNCSGAAIEAAADLVCLLAGNRKNVTLLPFHNLAPAKWAKLGRKHEVTGLGEPEPDVLKRIVAQFAEHGLVATIGG